MIDLHVAQYYYHTNCLSIWIWHTKILSVSYSSGEKLYSVCFPPNIQKVPSHSGHLGIGLATSFLNHQFPFFFCAWTIWSNVLELNLILFWQTGLPPFLLDFSDRLPSEWPQNKFLSMISSTFCKTLPPLPSKCCIPSYKFIVCTSLLDKCLL